MCTELCDVTQTVHEPLLLEGVSGSGLFIFVCTFKKKKILAFLQRLYHAKEFFSKAREMTTEKRNRLHLSTAEKILLMNKNLEI